jgi:prepilin-type N-terminal cleavage/methylation domain-containing protein
MMDFLKSKKGFSLPEIMIAVAISGVVALGAAQMMSDNQKNQSYVQTIAEINNMTNVVKMAIGDKKNCNSFLSGLTRGGGANIEGAPLNYTSIDIGDNSRKTSIVQISPFTYGKFSVAEIRLYKSAEDPKVKILELTFDYKNSPFMKEAGTDRKRIIKKISFLADYKVGTTGLPAASDPLECGDLVEDTLLESQEALCRSLGADFAEWGTPIANQCNIKEFKCPAGQVAWVVTSLGKVVCKNTEDTLDPNALIDGAPVNCPETSPYVRVEFSGGRYRLVCSGSCAPSCSSAGAWRICIGYSYSGGNDGCGGTCPVVNGTNPNTCASGLCKCSMGTLPNGTYCDTQGGSCGGNSCSECMNAPLSECANNGIARCGQIQSCPAACI